ncbi:MAG: hypothetical protein GWN46_05645, partial [Gammaproteobacteria bacterium]|nr:hypothetical protein [Gammaproteobacteria bacterium]
LTWVPGGDVAVSAPVWVDRAGNVEALPISADRFGAFRLSPDGQRLAIEVAAVNNDIRIYDLQTGRRGRLTLEGDNVDPYWTPDGEHVAFSSHREGGSGS